MEEEKTSNQSGLGVGALVLAIIAFLISVVPCIGITAWVPAAVAIVLAIVGLARPKNNQGMLVGGLVVAIIALMISVSQIFVIGKIANKSGNWRTNIEKAMKEVKSDLENEFGDKDFTIKINNDDDTIEIKASSRKNELKDRLEELEATTDTTKGGTKKDTTTGQW